MSDLTWTRFKDPSLVDRVPGLGPLVSVTLENGIFEGEYLRTWLGGLLAERGVRTFGDLADEAATRIEDRYPLVVMATDITRGELIRLPWDYERYGHDPDEQLVVDAVRASMAIPIFYEPARLRAADGRVSTLVDGGVLSNFPIDVFDRVDGREPRWPTFGVTLFPKLPEGNVRLLPLLPAVLLLGASAAVPATSPERLRSYRRSSHADPGEILRSRWRWVERKGVLTTTRPGRPRSSVACTRHMTSADG